MTTPRFAAVAAGRSVALACRLGEQRGVAAMEFALIAPVLAILLFGSAEVLRAVRARMLLTQAVSMTADVIAAQFKAVASASGGAGTLQDFCNGAKLILQPSMRNSFSLTIVNITYTPSNTSTPYAVLWEDDKACSPTVGAAYSVNGPPDNSAKTSADLKIVASQYVTAAQPTVIVIIGKVKYTPTVLTMQPVVGEAIDFTYTKYVNPRNTSLPCFNKSNVPCTTDAKTGKVQDD